jgi:hypothetical protein
VNSQPILFIQGAGSMHEPEGSGRLPAYLARELGTDYRLIAPVDAFEDKIVAEDEPTARGPGGPGNRPSTGLTVTSTSTSMVTVTFTSIPRLAPPGPPV